jgi:RNA-directed DNA polymerase
MDYGSGQALATRLAAVLLSGDWGRDAMLQRAEDFLTGADETGLPGLIDEILETQASPYPPSPRQLASLIRDSAFFAKLNRKRRWPGLGDPVLASPQFAPAAVLRETGVPALATAGDLAAWLGLPVTRLDWFADRRRGHGRADLTALQHYSYAPLSRRSGPPRLIEAPKVRLKAMQRRILAEILDRLPAHPAAHGFVKRRSILTAAQLHAGEAIVITVDLKDFFLTTNLGRVHGLFRSLGFPTEVARLLTGLCSTVTPHGVIAGLAPVPDWATQRLYRSPHLPQGAPTSPALANFCASALDRRLSALAARLDARYTRYADDLAFSGDADFARKQRGFLAAVGRITTEEGYQINARKTKIMHRGARQQITGLVVNSHVNVPGERFDALKAILTNCLRHGPASQNRAGHRDFRAHLDGRISFVESINLHRGLRLRLMFDRIVWDEQNSGSPGGAA